MILWFLFKLQETSEKKHFLMLKFLFCTTQKGLKSADDFDYCRYFSSLLVISESTEIQSVCPKLTFLTIYNGVDEDKSHLQMFINIH